MMLSSLDAETASLFLEIAAALVAADGEEHLRESISLHLALCELQASSLPRAPVDDAGWRARLERVTDPSLRRILLLELARLAATDGEVHPRERVLIDVVARSLDLSPGDVGRCLELGERAAKIDADARRLVSGLPPQRSQ